VDPIPSQTNPIEILKRLFLKFNFTLLPFIKKRELNFHTTMLPVNVCVSVCPLFQLSKQLNDFQKS
jgi:hypothetical protein